VRTLTETERGYVSGRHRCFAYLEVTNPDGTWINTGALAIGASSLDFFNTATIANAIDRNTLSFSATMQREIGNASLVPFRTDSAVNVDDSGTTYGPLLDLHREWRIFCSIVPDGATPAVSNFREMAKGVVDRIEITGDVHDGVITISGRGKEADILDAWVTGQRTYSADLEDVVQSALDDEFGTGVHTLEADPTSEHVDVTIKDTNLMPVLADSAALIGDMLRYDYDADDVLALRLITPNRDATTPDFSIGGNEYERLDVSVDISGVRNFIVVDYPDTDFGDQRVVSPAAETGTLSCTAGAGTFSASQADVIEAGARIVIDRSADGTGDFVAYKVLTFDGTTGCTLEGAPTFSAREWYTSASITKYGLRIYALDLTDTERIRTQAQSGGLADTIRADLQDPALEQAFRSRGLWFVQLGDLAATLANGVHYNEDQSGGVTSYTHTFANGDLDTEVGLAGKPKGRYALWRRMGTDNPRVAFTPEILQLTATPQELLFGSLRLPGIMAIASVNDRTRSVYFELGTSLDLASVVDTAASNVTGGFAQGDFGPTTPDTQYFVGATPYSGPLSGGSPTGIAGARVVVPVFNNRLTPSQAALDTIVDTVVAGLGTAANLGSLVVFVPTMPGTTAGAPAWLALSTIPTSETEVGTEYRRQLFASGAISVRWLANVKAITGTPTLKGKYTLNGFAGVSDLISYVPPGTGLRVSPWSTLVGAARADIGLTWYVADGADTAAIDLYWLALEFLPATVSGARIHTDAFAPAFV
jgi:hypothetical protein